MKASYKLQIEQHQRRLGMSHKELNKYDRKHNDINLINYLKSLNPVSGDTGFWGEFLVINGTQSGSNPRHMHAYLAYNDVPLTSSHQINGNQSHTFTIQEQDRLPLPSSILQLKVTMQDGTQAVDAGAYEGFTVTNLTDLPLTQENTLSMLVNENNLDDGSCSLTLLVTYVPAPQSWSGNITFVNNSGTGGSQQFISIKKSTLPISVDNYIYNSSNNILVASTNSDFYLYISIYSTGDWDWLGGSFAEAVGGYVYVFENNRGWRRYTIPSQFIGQNLTYNFSFLDNS